LSQLTDEAAVRLVARQDPEVRHPMGPGTPASLTEVLERSHAARTRGWAYVHDSFEEGISAMARRSSESTAEAPSVWSALPARACSSPTIE